MTVSCSESRPLEDRELSELGESLHRVAEVRCAHVFGQEPIERPLVDLEQLDLVDRTNGRLAPVRAEEAHLAERLAPSHRSEDPSVARLRILVFDLHGSRPDDVEGVRPISLPEDRLAGAEDPQADAPREIREDVLGKIVERRERVDQLRRLDPPGGLEAEPDRLGRAL